MDTRLLKAIRTQIAQWRNGEEEVEALKRDLLHAQRQAASAYDRGLTDGARLAADPYFKEALRHATARAFEGWAPAALKEFGKFQGWFRQGYHRPWLGPNFTVRMDAGQVAARVRVSIPAVHFEFHCPL